MLAPLALLLSLPGYDRFHAQQPPSVEAGLLLLGELGCANCHATPNLGFLLGRPGPDLHGAGSRLRLDRLPRGVMPTPASLSAADRAAVLGFLAASRAAPGASPLAGSVERGAALYKQVGCAVCHGAAPESNLRSSAVAAYLGAPTGRMPRVPLTGQEAADIAAHLARPDPAAPTPDPRGRAVFESAGCANCHALQGAKSALRAPRIAKLDQGCLADSPRGRAMDYGLDAHQRESIRLALRSVERGERPDAGASLRLRLAAWNCHACHTRGGRGPDPSTLDRFTETADTDLGDEGRLPPTLDATGYKLTPEALRRSMRGSSRVHVHMAARMPDYGAAAADDLARRFEAADLPAAFQPVERTGRNTFGRELTGITGLGCINCHDLARRKSLGIGASDLALAPKRLRVEWFRDFLIEPSRFHPGTRMPSFWPNGAASNKRVLAGNTARQIDSLWVYLLEIDQTRLPPGMEDKGAFEVKPQGRAVVMRAFMKDAGTHAVAVGYPGGPHAAFDSNLCRWRIAWKGRFLDAEGVWEDRFNPPLSPLGSDAKKLDFAEPAGVCQFGGYRLDATGAPTFLYSCGGVRYEDRLAPNAAGTGLTRTLRVGAVVRTEEVAW